MPKNKSAKQASITAQSPKKKAPQDTQETKKKDLASKNPQESQKKPVQQQAPIQKNKPLISVKKEITALIDSWYSKNKKTIETAYFETVHSYLPDKDIFWAMARSAMQFALNVKHVAKVQKFAPEWKKNTAALYPLCTNEFSCFINKIKGECINAENIVEKFLSGRYEYFSTKDTLSFFMHQHVLSQFTMLLEHAPSQFQKYSLSRPLALALLEKIYFKTH